MARLSIHESMMFITPLKMVCLKRAPFFSQHVGCRKPGNLSHVSQLQSWALARA